MKCDCIIGSWQEPGGDVNRSDLKLPLDVSVVKKRLIGNTDRMFHSWFKTLFQFSYFFFKHETCPKCGEVIDWGEIKKETLEDYRSVRKIRIRRKRIIMRKI